MKKIALQTGGHRLTIADFEWLQRGFTEVVSALSQVLAPSTDNACIISGCVVEGGPSAISIHDGAGPGWQTRPAGLVLYQGEVFEVESGTLTGTFTGPNYANLVKLSIRSRTSSERDTLYGAGKYPEVLYTDGLLKTVYDERVLTPSLTGTLNVGELSLVSNNAQSGTVVGFMPPAGSVLTDFVDSVTNAGKGRWRGWRRLTEANGRVLVGLDATQAEFDAIGETGGAKTHTLTLQQIPYHHHATWVNTPTGVSGGSNTYVGNVDGSTSPGSGSTLTREIYPAGVDINAAQNARGSLATDPATMGQAHNNLQPYLTMVWMIKL